jgi:hypothetical protein
MTAGAGAAGRCGDVRSDINLAIRRSSDRIGERAPLAVPFHDPLYILKAKKDRRIRNAGGRNARRRTTRPRCRSRLPIIRWDGVPRARSGSNPDPKWAVATAATGHQRAHHPSAAAPLRTAPDGMSCSIALCSVRTWCSISECLFGRVPVAGIEHVCVNGGRILARSDQLDSMPE